LADVAACKYELENSHIIISDTIFAIAENSKDGLERLLKFSSYMLESGIRKALPIRAAIDFGPAELDSNSRSVYGKAAVQAFNLAEEQDWIGTCCAENSYDESVTSEEERLPKLPYIDALWDYDLVFIYPVPMKNGKVLFYSNTPEQAAGYSNKMKREALSDEPQLTKHLLLPGGSPRFYKRLIS
jgi:hypothetical protein